MTTIKHLYSGLLRVLNPGAWLMNYSYDPVVDKFISEIIDMDISLADRSDCFLSIGDIHVWINNWPYGYSHVCLNGRDNEEGCGRPSYYTMRRLRSKLKHIPLGTTNYYYPVIRVAPRNLPLEELLDLRAISFRRLSYE